MEHPSIAWGEAVVAAVNPIMDAAGVGFTLNSGVGDPDGRVTTLLWEAVPARFVERYPDSWVVESYGPEQWPHVTCIDYWVYVEARKGHCRFSIEGFDDPAPVPLTGDGEVDGAAIAAAFAGVLLGGEGRTP